MPPKKLTKFLGITVLDERLTGVEDTGINVLIGGPGTGKSVACLQFLAEGLRKGERVALVSPVRPNDVLELARSVGINLASHLESGRCKLLGFQSGFRERFRRAVDPGEAFDELIELLQRDGRLDRVALDSCGSLVGSRESVLGGELVVEMLRKLEVASLVTLGAEDPGALGSAFDAVLQAASVVLHARLTPEGRREFQVRKAPRAPAGAGPIGFDIEEGAGIVPPKSARHRRASDVSPEVMRRVLLVDLAKSLARELRVWLQESFDFHYTQDPVDAFPKLTGTDFGLVVVHVDRYSVTRGLHVMSQLRRVASRPPILVLCPYNVRASDRAWALKAGADDFVSGGVNPEELTWRITALMRRGRAPGPPTAEDEATPRQPDEVGARPEELRQLVRSQLQNPGGSIFSLVLLRPAPGGSADSLVSHVASRMRRNTGDRLSVRGDHVEVYLHGAMADHAQRFLKRIKIDPWNAIGSEVYTAPTDRAELLEVIDSQHV